jgi:hypothetical protein
LAPLHICSVHVCTIIHTILRLKTFNIPLPYITNLKGSCPISKAPAFFS